MFSCSNNFCNYKADVSKTKLSGVKEKKKKKAEKPGIKLTTVMTDIAYSNVNPNKEFKNKKQSYCTIKTS